MQNGYWGLVTDVFWKLGSDLQGIDQLFRKDLPRGFEHELALVVDDILRSMPRREEKVLRLVYGLIGRDGGLSYADVARQFRPLQWPVGKRRPKAISKGRAHQLLEKSLRRLRHPVRKLELTRLFNEYGITIRQRW